jgi:hypothetical protein
MNIIIKDNNAGESIIDQNSVRWKLYARKTSKFFVLTYTLGLLLFIIGMQKFSEYGWKTFDGQYTYYTNWHFTESLGLVIILFTTYLLIIQFKTKKKFLKTVKIISDRHLKTTNEILIQATEDNLTYRSYELNQEIKWWLFSSYTLYDNYLFLNVEGNEKTGITLDKRLMNTEEFNQLLEFIKKRLVLKP